MSGEAGAFPPTGPHCRIELTPLPFIRRAAEDFSDRLAIVDRAERRTYIDQATLDAKNLSVFF